MIKCRKTLTIHPSIVLHCYMLLYFSLCFDLLPIKLLAVDTSASKIDGPRQITADKNSQPFGKKCLKTTGGGDFLTHTVSLPLELQLATSSPDLTELLSDSSIVAGVGWRGLLFVYLHVSGVCYILVLCFAITFNNFVDFDLNRENCSY